MIPPNFREQAEKIAKEYDLLDQSCFGEVIDLEDGYKDYLPYKIDQMESGRISLFQSALEAAYAQGHDEGVEKMLKRVHQMRVECMLPGYYMHAHLSDVEREIRALKLKEE